MVEVYVILRRDRERFSRLEARQEANFPERRTDQTRSAHDAMRCAEAGWGARIVDQPEQNGGSSKHHSSSSAVV